MRPIVWGFILTVTGAFFWVLFSVVFSGVLGLAEVEAALGLEGEEVEVAPFYMALIYISGLTMLFSLPVSIIIEVYRWLKRRRRRIA